MLELNKDKFRIIGIDDAEANAIVRPNITYWQDAWRRLKKNKIAMLSLGILALLVFMVIFGPFMTKYNFIE
jgi:oligopeptide transport system permease protein